MFDFEEFKNVLFSITYTDCLRAVKNDENNIRFVIEHFPLLIDKEICLEAVKRNGILISYMIKSPIVVKIIDKEICLEAVRQNGKSIRFIKESTETEFLLDKDIGLAAVINDPHSYSYIRDCDFVDREFLDLFIEDLVCCKIG